MLTTRVSLGPLRVEGDEDIIVINNMDERMGGRVEDTTGEKGDKRQGRPARVSGAELDLKDSCLELQR